MANNDKNGDRVMARCFCLMLTSLLGILSTATFATERVALVIGNGAYTTLSALANPPKDVRLVSKSLEDVGFDVTTLIDADIEAMDRAILNFARKIDRAGRETVGLFYYAGHGITYDGENWLIPVDAKINAGPEVKRRTVSAQYILAVMEEQKNATNIMILDACRDSPFRGLAFASTRSVRQGMAEMNAPEGSFIAFSTAAGKVAYDGEGNYSPFAEAFAAEIGTPNVSINSMMINVNSRVRRSTENLGAAPQVPWVNHSLSQDFWFNPQQGQTVAGGGGSVTPQPVPQKLEERPRQKTQEELEEQLWGDIKDSGDPAEYSIFLERFPDGRYADLAKARQARFSKKPEPVQQQPRQQEAKPVVQQPDPGRVASADNQEMVNLCRQFADGDSEDFADCMDELQNGGDPSDWEDDFGGGDFGPGMGARGFGPSMGGGNVIIWYDDEYNQWQVTMNGASFTASAFVDGTGMVTLQGQAMGNEVRYGIFNAAGQQIGYGGGTVTDPTHIAVNSFWANGTPIGSTRFHINHPPQ